MQSVFKRYEIKYKITTAQKEELLLAMQPYMKLDEYGRTTIRNIYFDSDNFRLIRRSIEKPVYKEKLRLRSYELVEPNKKVFVELKKKYNKVVYKRRLKAPEKVIIDAFINKTKIPIESQIAREIDYFKDYYGDLKPKVFLSYEREAYYSLDKSDLRITFDDTILYRCHDLSLSLPPSGERVLEEGYVLMEIKTSTAFPLWLANKLSSLKIYKTSFSKYGKAYEDIMKKK